MKKLNITFSFALLIIFSIACSVNEHPEITVQDFLNHIEQRNWDKAKTCVTPKSYWLVESQQLLSETHDIDQKQEEYSDFVSVIYGDSAVVTYNENGDEMQVILKKMEGKWLINAEMTPLQSDIHKAEEEAQKMEDIVDESKLDIDSSLINE